MIFYGVSMLILEKTKSLFFTISFIDVIDIIFIAILFKVLYKIIKGSRALQLLKGILVLIVLAPICKELRLYAMYWLLSKSISLLLIAMPVIFQPELRNTLEKIGNRFPGVDNFKTKEEALGVIDKLLSSIKNFSNANIGALIILQRETGLNEYVERGIKINAIVSEELLGSIFSKNSPLHDGAVIICRNLIVAAGCYLPLSCKKLASDLGTRHRAAIGISEETDSISLVVSEENGKISLVKNGHLYRALNIDSLKKYLYDLFIIESKSISEIFTRRIKQHGKKLL